MKHAWRAQLKKYADMDPTAKLLKKTEFPRMLKELLLELKPAEHLPKALEKCGLIPIIGKRCWTASPTSFKVKRLPAMWTMPC